MFKVNKIQPATADPARLHTMSRSAARAIFEGMKMAKFRQTALVNGFRAIGKLERAGYTRERIGEEYGGTPVYKIVAPDGTRFIGRYLEVIFQARTHQRANRQ